MTAANIYTSIDSKIRRAYKQSVILVMIIITINIVNGFNNVVSPCLVGNVNKFLSLPIGSQGYVSACRSVKVPENALWKPAVKFTF